MNELHCTRNYTLCFFYISLNVAQNGSTALEIATNQATKDVFTAFFAQKKTDSGKLSVPSFAQFGDTLKRI